MCFWWVSFAGVIEVGFCLNNYFLFSINKRQTFYYYKWCNGMVWVGLSYKYYCFLTLNCLDVLKVNLVIVREFDAVIVRLIGSSNVGLVDTDVLLLYVLGQKILQFEQKKQLNLA